MSSIWRGAYALTLAAALAGGATAQTADSGKFGNFAFATDTSEQGDAVELTNCEVGDCYGGDCYGGCDVYGDCGCDDGALIGCATAGGDGVCRRSRFFVGGEYLSVRANFSEATAFREISIADNTETFHQFNFDYGDSYRVFAGYQLCECDAEIRFTYTNFDTGGGFAPSEGNPTTNLNDARIAPFIEAPPTAGGTASVEVDNYDIGFAKSIPLGSPLCGSSCGDCCDPCGCGSWCPAWDIQWSGGIRVANVDSELGWGAVADATNNPPVAADRSAVSRVEFDGVGLRTGLLGRRYFGRTGLASLYVRGDLSLLLGDVDVSVSSVGAGAGAQPRISSTEVIPVTEIEAGGSLYLTPRLTFTGGYMLSAWHDLGHRFESDVAFPPPFVTNTLSADDANMLMFDGWFLRLEAFF